MTETTEKDPLGPELRAELRRRAEARALAEPPSPADTADAAQLLHEYRVHQIELEMQNEELQRIQAQLQESRAQLARLYDEAPVGYAQVDADGRLRACNRTMCALLGGAVKEGAFLHAFVDPDHADAFRLRFPAFFRHPEERALEVRLRGGTATAPRVVRLLGRRVADDPKVLALAVEDISRRWQAEQHGRRLATVLEAAQEFIVILDHDMRPCYVNPALRRVTGLAEDALPAVLEHLLSAEDARHLCAVGFPAARRDGKWQGEGMVRAADGGVVPVWHSVFPVRDSEGKVDEMAVLMTDLREYRRLGEQVRRAEQLAALGQLSAGVAHEFNNIMAVPMVVAQSLLIDAEEGALTLRPEQRRMLQDIAAAVQRGRDIVADLMLYARPRTLTPQPLRLAALLDDLLRQYERELAAERITVRRQYATPGETMGDYNQLYRAFLNLLGNARHAMRARGSGTLTVGISAAPTTLSVSISDDGIGMPAEVRSKLFTPFFTTKGAYARDGLGIKGTGLGLAVTRQIIAAHGGSIVVDSTPGKGSTFTVLLPMLHAESVPAAPPEPAPAVAVPRLPACRLLFVDDEPVVQSSLAAALRRAGATEVTLASSAGEALRLLAANPDAYDALLLDWMMPEGNGNMVVEYCRHARPNLPIIVISGNGTLVEELRGADGVRAVLAKPCELADLCTAVANAVG